MRLKNVLLEHELRPESDQESADWLIDGWIDRCFLSDSEVGWSIWCVWRNVSVFLCWLKRFLFLDNMLMKPITGGFFSSSCAPQQLEQAAGVTRPQLLCFCVWNWRIKRQKLQEVVDLNRSDVLNLCSFLSLLQFNPLVSGPTDFNSLEVDFNLQLWGTRTSEESLPEKDRTVNNVLDWADI